MHLIFAYIDPGVGLLAWQAAVAAVLGLVFYLKKTRDWLFRVSARLLRRKKLPVMQSAEVPARVDRIGR